MRLLVDHVNDNIRLFNLVFEGWVVFWLIVSIIILSNNIKVGQNPRSRAVRLIFVAWLVEALWIGITTGLRLYGISESGPELTIVLLAKSGSLLFTCYAGYRFMWVMYGDDFKKWIVNKWTA